MAAEASRRYRASGPVAQILLLAILVGLGALIWWGRDATLTAVSKGRGTIVANAGASRIPSPAGGTLAPHELQEGMDVVEGELLFRLESATETEVETEPDADVSGLRAAIARLTAEAGGADRIVYPDEIAASPAAAEETGRFQARRAERDRASRVLRDTAEATRLEIAENKAAAERHRKARDLAREELDVLGPLVDRGISPKLEYLRVQQKVQELDALRERALLAVPRLEAKLGELERQHAQFQADFATAARRDLKEKQNALEAAQRTRKTVERQVTTTEIRAPISGRVRQLFIDKQGATVREGQALVVLGPAVDEILIPASVSTDSLVGARTGEAATIAVSHQFTTVVFDAMVADVDPSERNGIRRINLRIGPETPGFSDLLNYEGDVEVSVFAEQPLLVYFLDRLSVASGGRTRELLSGH